jgi:hypothetical protein
VTPEEFKKQWQPDKFHRWADLDVEEIDKAPLNDLTKNYLKSGFPEDAAPFLHFGWRSNKGKFENVADNYLLYENDNLTQNYWMIGSDGSGNPICFDVSQNDRIVLLDHEQRFEIICLMNSNIKELAACLLLYKNFIGKFRKENDQSTDAKSNFSIAELSQLKNEFRQINNNIFRQNEFWRSEIDALADEIG